jgi:serine/threonine-protein kinase
LLVRVGLGGTSAVYLAEDLVLERRVAIKLLLPSLAPDDEIVEGFRREASRAADLQHPHIVSIYDTGEWNGMHYIGMEYVGGCSLKSLIRRKAPFAPRAAITLALQLARAVRYIHGRDIVHRDLKPDNAIVDAGGYLKLIDFGIASRRDRNTAHAGNIVGTAEYMSPEQAQGHPVGFASDIYSMGVILYELLTGRVPFRGETVVEIISRHVTELPVPPRAINPTVTGELDAIVRTALEKRPLSRFADADALIGALAGASMNRQGSRFAGARARADCRRVLDGEHSLAETKQWGRLDRLRASGLTRIAAPATTVGLRFDKRLNCG